MPESIRRVVCLDDLWSVLGYVSLVASGKLVNPDMPLPALSLLGSGMLAIFWLASEKVRSRTRYADARIALWALVAALSGLFLVYG